MMPHLCYFKGEEVYVYIYVIHYIYICYIYIYFSFSIYTCTHMVLFPFWVECFKWIGLFYPMTFLFFLRSPEKRNFKLVLFFKFLVFSRGCCIYMYIYMTLNIQFLGSDMVERCTLFPLF